MTSSSSWQYCPDCGQGFACSSEAVSQSAVTTEPIANKPWTSWLGTFWSNFSGFQPSHEQQQQQSHHNQFCDWNTKCAETRDRQKQYQTTCYSSEPESDRLNLSLTLSPPLSRDDRVQGWLNTLDINAPHDNPCWQCQSTTEKFDKKKELIAKYIESSEKEVKKLQKTLEEYDGSREAEFGVLSSLFKENAEIKLQIAQCAQTQREILDKFIYQSNRLDIEFDTEERMNAAQAEEALETIQEQLFAEIVRKESHSMIRLFKP